MNPPLMMTLHIVIVTGPAAEVSSRFPVGPEFSRSFIKHYLTKKAELEGRETSAVMAADIEKYLQWIKLCTMVCFSSSQVTNGARPTKLFCTSMLLFWVWTKSWKNETSKHRTHGTCVKFLR